MEPLIAPLGAVDAASAAQACGLADAFVKMNLFRTTLRQPGVARLWSTVVERLVVTGTLDARLRELVILRVAWVTGGVYEWSNHYAFSRSIGMSDAEIVAVRDLGNPAAVLSGDDRVVLETVDELLSGRPPGRARVTCLREIVAGDGPLMELLILPGIYHALAMLTGTLGIALDDGKGEWLPDGEGPTSGPANASLAAPS